MRPLTFTLMMFFVLLLTSFSSIFPPPCVSLVFVPLFVFLFSIYSLALMKVTMDLHQVPAAFCLCTITVFNTITVSAIVTRKE